jgi:predicted nucleic acid-binding protein
MSPERQADAPTGRRRSNQDVTYVETSALLAALLEQDANAKLVLRRARRRVTSALTLAEARRALVRARKGGRLNEVQERAAVRALRTFARRCDIVAITDEILDRAERPFPIEPIRTLDAIHLATAEALGEPPPLLGVLTRDTRVRDNAATLGYRTL